MSVCRVVCCVLGRGCLLWPVSSLGKTLLAFALLPFVLQGQTCLLLQVSLDFLLFLSSPLWWKRHLLGVLVLEGLVGCHRTVHSQPFTNHTKLLPETAFLGTASRGQCTWRLWRLGDLSRSGRLVLNQLLLRARHCALCITGLISLSSFLSSSWYVSQKPWSFSGTLNESSWVHLLGGGGGGLVTKMCPTLVTLWTVACQAPLSMGCPRQEYWSGLPSPSPGDLPNSGIEPRSPVLQADSLPTELWGFLILIQVTVLFSLANSFPFTQSFSPSMSLSPSDPFQT